MSPPPDTPIKKAMHVLTGAGVPADEAGELLVGVGAQAVSLAKPPRSPAALRSARYRAKQLGKVVVAPATRPVLTPTPPPPVLTAPAPPKQPPPPPAALGPADDDAAWLQLYEHVSQAYEARGWADPNLLSTVTGWDDQGFQPALCLAVVKGGLDRAPQAVALSSFTSAIERAHAGV